MNIFKKAKKDLNIFPKIKKKDFDKKDTPIFITDTSIISLRYQSLKKSLKQLWGGKNIIAYSFKTNYEIAKILKKQKIENYAEVVSKMEYDLAKSLGYPDSQIIFNGPYKENLSKILPLPTIINIDNFSEIDQITKYQKKIKSSICLRLNSDLKKSRFGFNIESKEIDRVIKQLKNNNIQIDGFHVHFGFYTSPKRYRSISEKIINLIKSNNLNLKYLNFGGGFPSHGNKPYKYKKNPYHSIENYISQICNPLNSFFTEKNKPFLILEPGRFLVDDSTVLISKIVDCKIINKKQNITVDSTNHMISSVWFRPQIVKIFNSKKTDQQQIDTIVYGASCQEDDVLYQGKMPIVNNDNFVIFYCVGAYNENMTGNFIFLKPNHFYTKN